MLSGQEAPVCTFDRLIQCSVALCLNVFFALHSSCLASDVSAVHPPFIVCTEGACLLFKLLSKFHMYSNVGRGEAPLLKFFDIA